MRKVRAGLWALLVVVLLVVAGCSSKKATGGGQAAKGKIAVLLPDSKSSARWETNDRPYFVKAFTDAGLTSSDYIIQNAQGSAQTQQTQAEQAITNGATVILLVDLDSGSGAAIESNAKSKGVQVVDYDRLTLKGSASYYVSFNNVTVGKLQGQGLVSCLKAKNVSAPSIVELNGSPTDNNATLFKQGYDSVLSPMYQQGWKKVADQSVPEWDNQKALTIFEQIQTAHPKIDGVLAANDGLGNAVISALKEKKANGIPVTGQDATVQGIQNILAGDQCMTVYKPIQQEAAAAAKLALELRNGQTPAEASEKVNDTVRDVPSVLLTPIAVTADNIKDTVIKDGFVKPADVCTGQFQSACAKAGIQ
jgi:D-xylose transport system substrate-binding protein